MFLFPPLSVEILCLQTKVISYMLRGTIIPIYNEEIISEYSEVLRRPKFHLNKIQINTIIDYIQVYGIHCDRTPYIEQMTDEKDRPFYEVSLSIKDAFLVTGNLKHFPTTPKVITPAKFIAIIEEQIIRPIR